MPNLTLHVRIISPQKLILETEAESVSSKNLDGPFDILSLHANFLTVIEKQPIVVRINGQKPLTYNFPFAIIFAQKNQVNIYTYSFDQVKKEGSAYIQPQMEKK